MKHKMLNFESKFKAINRNFLMFFIFGLIGFQLQAQIGRVIDNKGTIREVRNNQVTTSSIEPTSPLENDIWIDTTSNTVKVWEGTPLNAWQEMASIRNWISNTNSGTYAIDHLVSYNGAIYKNITGTNTDIAPDLDITNWEVLKSSILSDADGDTKIQVEESADEDLIRFDLAGTEKFVMRGSTIEPVNNGNSVFIGENAGLNDNLTNNQNIAIGTNTLRDNVAAFQNVAIGQNALLVNTGGHNNFALGRNSLLANTVGDVNVGLGGNTLSSNINGEGNLAIGASSLSGNISGDNNVAIGRRALRLNQSGNNNVAIGAEAGDNLISGLRNTIIGDETGWGVTTGSDNTIIGSRVKGLATDLSNNIIFSDGAGNIQLQNDGTRWQSEDELQAGSFDTAWQNNTNGGVYAANDLVIYSGGIYKNLTGTNLDTTPDLDTTNWTEVVPDFEVVPLWKSDTNGGSYATDDIINYNGILYKNLTGTNLDTTPNLDTTNWVAFASTSLSDTDGDTSVEVERTADIDKVYIKTNGVDRITTDAAGSSFRGRVRVNNGTFPTINYLDIEYNGGTGVASLKSIGNGNSSMELFTSNGGTQNLGLRIDKDQNVTIPQDLTTDTFSTAWVNNTNGGVYVVNDLVIYLGGIYKNLTGNNTNTTPNADTTNWSAIVGGSSVNVVNSLNSTSTVDALSAAQGKNLQDNKLNTNSVINSATSTSTTSPVSAAQVRLLDIGKLDKVDVTGTEQFMGYQINGRDVYQKYVSGTSPTGFTNLYLEINGVDTLLSVEGVISRNGQPQWHLISQMGNDRDGHAGAVYQENDDIAMYGGALLSDFQGQPFKVVLKYTK